MSGKNPLTRGKKQKARALIGQQRPAEAKVLLEQACHLDQRDPEAWYLLGAVNQQLGDQQNAIACYWRALEVDPGYAEACYNLGALLLLNASYAEVSDLCERTLQFAGERADLRFYLGIALKHLGRTEAAERELRRSLALQPDLVEALNSLGNILSDSGRQEEAIACYRQAISLRRDYAEAHYNLGMALRDLDRLTEAQSCFERTVALDPMCAEAHNDLGNTHLRNYQLKQAIDCYRRAIGIHSRYDSAYNNLGSALLAQQHLDEAIAAYRQAVRLNPENAEAHFNLSMALLLTGNFREGWSEFEWRWRTARLSLRPLAQPLWDGSDLEGRTLLLHAEAGLGDTLQFIRYAPLIARRGGRVIVECQPPLKRLLTRMDRGIVVFTRGESLPPFDVHAPLMSLPKLFSTTLETIPSDTPYLTVYPDESALWRERLAANPGFKVGLVWSGDPRKHDPECRRVDQRRSLLLAAYQPLAKTPGVQFYSLQKGEAAEQTRQPPTGLSLIDYTDSLQDFADTAALVANLDLVISVDTSVAHLAGALRKPVWLLSRYNGCWRWLTERIDTPWYPTMRIFRQETPGYWDDVMLNVAANLREWVETGGHDH